MKLRQLKKQLKQDLKNQLTERKKKNNKKSFILVFLVVVLAIILVQPQFREYRSSQPERLIKKGVQYESLGQLKKAEALYKKIFQNYSDSDQAAEALLRTGRIWQHDRKDIQQALLIFLKIEHDYPDSPYVVPAREEAAWIIKYALREYSRAIGYYQHLLDLNPGSSDHYLYEIADCYFRLENYTQARIELETLLEEYPESELRVDSLYRIGGILVLENHPGEARKTWERLIAEYPQSNYRSQVEFNLARLLEEQGQLSEALDVYRNLKDFPRPSLLQEKIDHLQQRMAKKKKAI